MVPGKSEARDNPSQKRNFKSPFVRMRCPNCGLAVQGAPEKFQDTIKCPNCEKDVIFLRIAEVPEALPGDNTLKNIKAILPKHKSRRPASLNPLENILEKPEEPLLIRMKCPSCGAIVRSTPGKMGEVVRCPRCRNENVFRRAPAMEEDILPFAAGPGSVNRVEAYSIPWGYLAGSFFLGFLLAAVIFYFNPRESVSLNNSPQARKLSQLLEISGLEQRRAALHSYLKALPETKEMSSLRSKALADLDKINTRLLAQTASRQKERVKTSSLLQAENVSLKASLQDAEKALARAQEESARLKAKNKFLEASLADKKQIDDELSAKMAALTTLAAAEKEKLLALQKQFENFRNSREKPEPVEKKVLHKLAAKISPSVLTLRVKTLSGETRRGRGCVVAVQGRKVILTSADLIRYATGITAAGATGKEFSITSAAGVDEAKGIAFLALPEAIDPGPGLPLAETPPLLGDAVIAPGVREGESYRLRPGYISQLRRLQTGWIQNRLAAQTDLALSPDCEGGPLLNRKGEVTGINIKLNGREPAQNFLVDLSGIKAGDFFKKPVPLAEIEATRIEAARQERLKAEALRRSENIQSYYKKGYKMSAVGLMFKVPELSKEKGGNAVNLELQVVNPGLSVIAGDEFYLVGFDTYTRAKAWSKLGTTSFKGEGWSQEKLLLKGFPVAEDAWKRMSWDIIRGWNKLELFIGAE